MIDFLETIVAARKKGGWIELLVPVIFVVIYIVSALGKLKKGAGDEEGIFETRPGLRDTEGKFRYKALDEADVRERPAGPRSVPPRAKTLPYAKPGAPGTPRQHPAPRQPQPVAVARRPQPTVQRPARVPTHMRPQTPPVRPGPIRPAQVPPQRPKPKSGTSAGRFEPKVAPKTSKKPRKLQKVAATEAKVPSVAVRKRTTLRAELSGSSNLQRAIIYSEILGKPLALRDM
ncbi:MAG: hypothetical protein DRP65_08850 [Planctomycetota bacterium]|nr:MAG: hypothetical protein DRP65_08850 [Planctomycetota bacterium]